MTVFGIGPMVDWDKTNKGKIIKLKKMMMILQLTFKAGLRTPIFLLTLFISGCTKSLVYYNFPIQMNHGLPEIKSLKCIDKLHFEICVH